MKVGSESTFRRRARGVASLVAAALVWALVSALPSTAGEEHFYEGDVTNGTGEIEFVLQRKHGDVMVKDFHADDLTEICAVAPSRYENFGIRAMKVRKRRFHEVRNIEFRGTHIAEVRGRLRRGGRASGTVRLFRGLDEVPVCDTGTLEWKASD